MAKIRLTFPIDRREAEAFKARCAELGLTQAEIIRSLLRQWVSVGNGHAVVIPGDVAGVLLSMDTATMAMVIARREERIGGG